MIFLAQVFHVDLSWAQIGSVIGILMLTSKGAAGVTGSGFIVLASTLTTIKVIPVEGLALLLGSTANGVLHRAKCDVLAVRLQND